MVTADSSTTSATLGVVLAADPAGAVDGELGVQAVPAQQHGLRRIRVAAVPDELLRVGQPDGTVRGLRGQRAPVDDGRR